MISGRVYAAASSAAAGRCAQQRRARGIVHIPALRIGAHGLRALVTWDAAAGFCNDLAGSEHARGVFFWQMFTYNK